MRFRRVHGSAQLALEMRPPRAPADSTWQEWPLRLHCERGLFEATPTRLKPTASSASTRLAAAVRHQPRARLIVCREQLKPDVAISSELFLPQRTRRGRWSGLRGFPGHLS